MLVLSRQTGDALQVGDSLVTVTSITPDTAELKIETAIKGEVTTQRAKLKKNENIQIQYAQVNIIVVEIREVEPSILKVRLGIEAPKEVPVHRKEVYDAIHREKMQLQIAESDPAPHIAVDFGPGFSEDEVEACLSYLSEIYRARGGVGLKVVRSQTMVPDAAEVPHVD